jgi:redox-sensitive bicupin YhaK (pirin superfamily)
VDKPQGTSIAILMGALMGMDGAIQRPLTAPMVIDIKIEAGVTEWIPLKTEHHAALYVIRGGIALGQDRLTQREMGILEQDPTAEGVYLTTERQSQVLLIAGKPLEILQAIEDFRSGRLTVPPDEKTR